METLRPDWKKIRYAEDRLDLSNNICYDAVLLKKIDQIFKHNDISLRQYPDEAVAYKILSDHYNIPMQNISVGFGIGELIIRILQLSLVKKISIVSPTWPMVEVYSKIYQIDHSSCYDNTANVLYLANPNGVDGSIILKSEIENYLNDFDLVIVDEAYADFDSSQSVLNQAHLKDNLVVLKTFSKSLSLAGLRFGYAFSNSKIIKELQEKRPSGATTDISIDLLPKLIDLIPEHVERMLYTKKYIEENYNCLESHGNYVIFKSNPDFNSAKLKEIKNVGYRMALTDIETFRKLIT